MNETDVLELATEAVWVTIKLAGPLLIVALVVGFAISLIQALTQIQEMTLAFVPKIFLMFLCLLFLFPYMLTTLATFTEGLMSRIVQVGAGG